jgi:alkylhydroperoxidase/carboxymuconolactone decarboxylase family protein YurZ
LASSVHEFDRVVTLFARILMNNENEKRPQKDDLKQQLAKALGADVQRLLVFFSLYENAFVQGALPGKVKHLIALAMAIGGRISEGITYHVNEALQAGASRDEIRETVTVAVLIAGVPSLLSGVEALATMTQYKAQKMISSCGPPANGTHG